MNVEPTLTPATKQKNTLISAVLRKCKINEKNSKFKINSIVFNLITITLFSAFGLVYQYLLFETFIIFDFGLNYIFVISGITVLTVL